MVSNSNNKSYPHHSKIHIAMTHVTTTEVVVADKIFISIVVSNWFEEELYYLKLLEAQMFDDYFQ